MPNPPTDEGSLTAESVHPYSIMRTSPEELLRHDIADEELSVLEDTRRDYLWEGKWVALGIACGAAPSSISILFKAFIDDNRIPITVGALMEIVITFVAFAVFCLLWRVMKTKTIGARDLAKDIRERTKQQVTHG